LIDNKLKSKYFLECVLAIRSKELTESSKQEIESQIKDLLGTRKFILAESFYNVLISLNIDIDDFCDNIFGKLKITTLYPLPESDNKLNDFISPFVQDTKEIASAIVVDNSRLSRLLSGEFKHLYPNEVYSIAIFFGLRPQQLFQYLYGGGMRPIVGL